MVKEPAMQPKELRAIVQEVYGHRGQRKLAADIYRGEVTVSRWLSGYSPIEETEAVLLRLILLLHRRGYNWRKWLEQYAEDMRKPYEGLKL